MTPGGELPAPRPGWAYFRDIEGTLVDIADSPAGARLDPAFGRLVEGVHRSAGGAVALISGRSIGDIDRLFPAIRFPVAGQHGVERRDAAGRISRHAFPSQELDWVRRRLADAAARHPGLLVEDKGLSVALHYRRGAAVGGGRPPPGPPPRGALGGGGPPPKGQTGGGP